MQGLTCLLCGWTLEGPPRPFDAQALNLQSPPHPHRSRAFAPRVQYLACFLQWVACLVMPYPPCAPLPHATCICGAPAQVATPKAKGGSGCTSMCWRCRTPHALHCLMQPAFVARLHRSRRQRPRVAPGARACAGAASAPGCPHYWLWAWWIRQSSCSTSPPTWHGRSVIVQCALSRAWRGRSGPGKGGACSVWRPSPMQYGCSR